MKKERLAHENRETIKTSRECSGEVNYQNTSNRDAAKRNNFEVNNERNVDNEMNERVLVNAINELFEMPEIPGIKRDFFNEDEFWRHVNEMDKDDDMKGSGDNIEENDRSKTDIEVNDRNFTSENICSSADELMSVTEMSEAVRYAMDQFA